MIRRIEHGSASGYKLWHSASRMARSEGSHGDNGGAKRKDIKVIAVLFMESITGWQFSNSRLLKAPCGACTGNTRLFSSARMWSRQKEQGVLRWLCVFVLPKTAFYLRVSSSIFWFSVEGVEGHIGLRKTAHKRRLFFVHFFDFFRSKNVGIRESNILPSSTLRRTLHPSFFIVMVCLCRALLFCATAFFSPSSLIMICDWWKMLTYW